jgi:CheY-like chemotaxis protein
MNLCVNAYHAIGVGGGTITIACRSIAEGTPESDAPSLSLSAEHVIVEVRDTGSGMSKETMAHMYDPYFTTKQGEGTGLGLAIVKSIVEAHRGKVVCVSEVGKGTTFRIYFPKVKIPSPAARKEINAAWERGQNNAVLLVEDDEAVGQMLEHAMARLGYQCLWAVNGLDALQRLRQDPFAFDLLLADLNMPQMGGFELVQKVQTLRHELPVVLMSGSADVMTEKYVQSKGVSACLKKPFTIEELSKVLKAVVERKPL